MPAPKTVQDSAETHASSGPSSTIINSTAHNFTRDASVSERTPLIGRPSHSGSVGSLSNLQEDIEARWTRWKDKVARLAKPRKGTQWDEAQLLISVFGSTAADAQWREARDGTTTVSGVPYSSAWSACS